MAASVPFTELDVEEVCATALSQFGEAWHNDNVNYIWIVKNWSKTHGMTKPKNWPSKNIKDLYAAVSNKLTATHPPSDPASSRQTVTRTADRDSQSMDRSRSPHRPPADAVGSQAGGFHSSNSSWSWDALQNRKVSIVRDLMMDLSASALPRVENWRPEIYVPRQTIDEWVEELHDAVNESRLCAWPPGMTKRQQGVHAVGLATLSYGYCFKFRFVDDGVGALVWHGTPASSVFPILRNNFRPRVAGTFSDELQKRFGCVPPLAWFSSNYKTAAGYPMHLWYRKWLPMGEPIALDISPSIRFVFHVRVKKEERLAKPIRSSEKNQQGYSPVSVLRIIGLDAIALSMSYAETYENWLNPTRQLSDFCDIDALENFLETWVQCNRPDPEFGNVPLDPRGLMTRSPEHMIMMKRIFDQREQLLQDQAEMGAFHNAFEAMDRTGECTAESVSQLLQGVSERVKALLVRSTMKTPHLGTSFTQGAIELNSQRCRELSEELNSQGYTYRRTPKEVAGRRVPADRKRGTVIGTDAIKKYKRYLRAAKDPAVYEKNEVYEWACPTPILPPDRIPEAISASERASSSSSRWPA